MTDHAVPEPLRATALVTKVASMIASAVGDGLYREALARDILALRGEPAEEWSLGYAAGAEATAEHLRLARKFEWDRVKNVPPHMMAIPEVPDPLRRSDMSEGADLIRSERRRQIDDEGYDATHDAGHGEELAAAGAAYAYPMAYQAPLPDQQSVPLAWPWHPMYWKPTPDDRVRELVKAGALIAAAIDSLLGAAATPDAPPEPSAALKEHIRGEREAWAVVDALQAQLAAGRLMGSEWQRDANDFVAERASSEAEGLLDAQGEALLAACAARGITSPFDLEIALGSPDQREPAEPERPVSRGGQPLGAPEGAGEGLPTRVSRIVARLPRLDTEADDFSWVSLGDVLVAISDPDAAERAWPEGEPVMHLDGLTRPAPSSPSEGAGENPMTGAELIAAERQRQIDAEGYDAEHDAGHARELAFAGAAYAIPEYAGRRNAPPSFWPWDLADWNAFRACLFLHGWKKAAA